MTYNVSSGTLNSTIPDWEAWDGKCGSACEEFEDNEDGILGYCSEFWYQLSQIKDRSMVVALPFLHYCGNTQASSSFLACNCKIA